MTFHYSSFLAVCLFAGASAAPAFALTSESINTNDDTPPTFQLYTHGESSVAYQNSDHAWTGASVDVARCATQKHNMKLDIQFAPLSRAGLLSRSDEAVFWTPVAEQSARDRNIRFFGPVGNVDILWYQKKEDPRDPETDSFKQNAIVTAYRGSSLNRMLSDDGYKSLSGPPDHRHLLEMLLNSRVDAILAVNFVHLLPPSTLQRFEKEIRTTVRTSIPVGFSVSKGFIEQYPQLTDMLDVSVRECHQTLHTPR